MSLSTQELETLRWGAVLHDIGKIGVEDKILKKQAPLEEDEWKVMQRHPEFGFDIMNRVEGFEGVIDGMHFHHERWDGKGYPNGLKGEQIPWVARIISVADTYDAMVSTRPYRKGLDPKFAHDEIVKHSGTQFAPEVVEAFKQAFQKEKMGKGSGGSTLSNCD
jgi:HD-GYP domain-containing protein (c-di-GMP phosphodiesterase class II)